MYVLTIFITMTSLTLGIAVLLCVAAVFGARISKGKGGIETRRITANVESFNCRIRTFKDYNAKNKCCNYTVAEIFNVNLLNFCNRNLADQSYMKDYLFNTFQDSDFNNLINYDSQEFKLAVGKATCLAECVFKNAGRGVGLSLFKDSKVDYEALTKFLETKNAIAPELWLPQLKAIITHCKTRVAEVLSDVDAITTNEVPARTCKFEPLALMQCIRYNMIGACNPEKEPTGPAALMKECADGAFAQDQCTQVFGDRYDKTPTVQENPPVV